MTFVTGAVFRLYNCLEEYSVWISPSSARSGYQAPLLCYLDSSYQVEVGAKDMGSGDTMTVDVHVHLEALLGISSRTAC